MGIFTGMEISATGMKAERFRMDLISLNIANKNSVKVGNEPLFQPRRLVTSPRASEFRTFMTGLRTVNEMGVNIDGVVEEETPGRKVYEPANPYADASGYVEYPDINVLEEMVQAIQASRSYEANVTAFNETKSMMNKALEIGK